MTDQYETNNNSSMQPAGPIELGDIAGLFEQVTEIEANVIAVHTHNVDETMTQFAQLCRRSGRSIYQWTDNLGLKSMKESEINVPGSRRLAEALRYILQSMHYGVYIFTGFERQLRQPCINLLRQIARIRTGYDRKVVLMGNKIALPMKLSDVVTHIVHQKVTRQRPKLRDGRWVF